MSFYIIFDFEFNQDFSDEKIIGGTKSSYPFEIIQIGAIKLDAKLNTIAHFNRYVRPVIYSNITPFITELTGITTVQLQSEHTFPDVYQDFIEFIGTDSIFLSWGRTDVKELFRSADYFKLDSRLLPRLFIDLQPYASLYLKQPEKKLLRLQYTVEALGITQAYPFHNAYHDAYYTAEIFKQIGYTSMKPMLYSPQDTIWNKQNRVTKKIIDYASLIHQFEKMYQRPMSIEEQEIIKLAYKMGKTGQFIKLPPQVLQFPL